MEDEYSYCPLCGEEWGENPKKHKCDLMNLIDQKKPKFYLTNLNNYTPEFLVEIIKWQDMKIRAFHGADPHEFDLDLKTNDDIVNKFTNQNSDETNKLKEFEKWFLSRMYGEDSMSNEVYDEISKKIEIIDKKKIYDKCGQGVKE